MSDVRKADILSHCSSQITASNGSKRVSSISATTNALTKPLKILFTVRFTFSYAKKNGGPLMLLGKGEIELKSVGQILQIVHL